MTEPGYIDFHVHVGERIAGNVLRDDFRELGNLTQKQGLPGDPPLAGIGVFVTESPQEDFRTKIRTMQAKARRDFGQPVQWHLTPVDTGLEELLPFLREGCDLKFYTTYQDAGLYCSYARLDRWMQDLGDMKTRILVHCEDDATIQEYSTRHPFRHPHDHCLRRPELAENKAVEKVMDLAVRNQHPVHIVHVSSPASALLIRSAQQHFPGITCETAPHYLMRNEDDLIAPQAHRLICTPPYRSESSRGMLVELMQDGVFDILASDHCPFTIADKDKNKANLEKVPCGISGIESLYTSIYEYFVQPGKLPLESLNRMLITRPAELMNLS